MPAVVLRGARCWIGRNARQELLTVLDRYRSRDGSNWDCVVPVSGGKDSTYQVIRMLQLGLNPLCFTATTCDLSDVGRKNIENIKSLGVDYIEFSPNKQVRSKLNRIGLTQVGLYLVAGACRNFHNPGADGCWNLACR